jgi:hypothetical protein
MIRLISIFTFSILVFSMGCVSSGEETVVPAVTPTSTATNVEKSTGSGHGDSLGTSSIQSNKNPEEIFTSAMCVSCHKIEGTSAQSEVGPELTHIGTIGATRKPGISAEDYIRESIEDPGSYIVAGYSNIMPPGQKDGFGEDYETIITYLVSLK